MTLHSFGATACGSTSSPFWRAGLLNDINAAQFDTGAKALSAITGGTR